MSTLKRKIISFVLCLTVFVSLLSAFAIGGYAESEKVNEAGGWFESAYAKWTPVSGADGYNAYIAEYGSSNWNKIDCELVRSYSDYCRVDALGLKAGEYQIKIVPTLDGAELNDKAFTTDSLNVLPYDRSGYAHFNYTDGVGAYNDDGTLKDGAIVLYVTDENKDSVSVSAKDGTTVVGIGNILNSVGQDVGGGLCSKGGVANSNSDIIRKLAKEGTPLVVRIIGNVNAPVGLTEFNGVNYGGTEGDNGFMARMSGGKDITIEGIGSDAVINGWGLHFICQTADYSAGIGRSFEVRNISFKNVPEDCIGMEGQQSSSVLTAPVERCWIHHCTFYAPVIANPAESDKDGGDGACDFKRGQYFTNSYCYYNGYHKTNLLGSSDSSLQYHVSYHHNYWKDCESRGPLARQANIHMYNNIFDGQTSYCMNPRANAYIFSEYNMFLNSKNPVTLDSGGVVKSYNDSYASCIGDIDSAVVENRTDKVSSSNKYADFENNSTISYIPTGDYIIQESISEMRKVVLAYAGTQKDVILSPEEVRASVIPADRYPTAPVVLDYSKNTNNSAVPSVKGTYDNIVFNVKKVSSDCITVGGTATGCDIVFYVDTEVNIYMTAAEATYLPVLCNEYGEQIISGSGSATELPAGFYFIQSGAYDVGSAKYKESKISMLTITAVDPNAATNPIPTPPVDPDSGNDSGNTGDGGNTGDSGSTGSGGGTVTEGTVITPESQVHSFTNDLKKDPEGFFTINGNTSDSKGSVSFNGESLTVCLKIESSTVISFNATEKGTLVLVFGGSTSASGKDIKINGIKQEIPSTQILEISLEAGSHQVTKEDSINLFYMAFVPASSQAHTHSYVDEETKEVSCTEPGLITYVCSCGDSYTEEIPAKGHDFVDGICVDCGIDDPSVSDTPDNPNNPNTPDNPDNPNNPDTPDNPNNPDEPSEDEEPEELNFLQRIWKAIVDFFKRLFGKKD